MKTLITRRESLRHEVTPGLAPNRGAAIVHLDPQAVLNSIDSRDVIEKIRKTEIHVLESRLLEIRFSYTKAPQ